MKILKLIIVISTYILFNSAEAQINGNVKTLSKISKLFGVPDIASAGSFGVDCDTLSDIDGDGVMDVVVGSPYSFVQSQYSGMLHILYLNSNKTIKNTKIISRTSGNLNLPSGSSFDLIGMTVCNIGDFDHDNINDIAISMENNNQVSLLMLNANGTVKTTYNLATSINGFFGCGIINLGDIDNDGTIDLMINAYHSGIYIAKLNSNGTLKTLTTLLTSQSLGYSGSNSDNFPSEITQIGDLDGNGICEIVASAPAYNNSTGEIVVIFLNQNYTVKSTNKITSGSPNFTLLNQGDMFGNEVKYVGDIDGDGIGDIFAGAIGDDYGGANTNNYGAVYEICLNNSGGVKSFFKLDKGDCILNKFLKIGDCFGQGISILGDLDHDGNRDYLISAMKDDDGGIDNGAVYIISLGSGLSQSSRKDTSICQGSSIVLNASANSPNYLWNTGDTLSHITVNTPGLYYCELSDLYGCKIIDSINVTVIKKPIKHSNQIVELCINESMDFKAETGFNYVWTDNSTNQTYTLKDSGLYWVKVFNQCDTIVDSVFVKIKDCTCNIFIPNVFTPNGDGLNESFFPSINCELDEYQLYIYNRWGMLIFESTNQKEVWDGKYKNKEVPEGVYFFIMHYKHLNTSKSWQDKRGSITVLR